MSLVEAKTVMFDLDGTLIDSAEVLVGALQAGLKAIGHAPAKTALLRRQIGRTLPDVLETLAPERSQELEDRFVAGFREKFRRTAPADYALYDGVEELLRRLKGRGVSVAVVTTKPELFAREIVSALPIAPLVDHVVGGEMAEGKTDKAALVRRCLAEGNFSAADAVMVGDREYDVRGALASDVEPVGVLWGYGSKAELEAAGCQILFDTVDGLAQAFGFGRLGSKRALDGVAA